MSKPSRAAERLRAALTREEPETPETQAELARTLGVSRGAVQQWLTGEARPGLERAVRLEALYGIPAAEWLEPGVGAAP